MRENVWLISLLWREKESEKENSENEWYRHYICIAYIIHCMCLWNFVFCQENFVIKILLELTNEWKKTNFRYLLRILRNVTISYYWWSYISDKRLLIRRSRCLSSVFGTSITRQNLRAKTLSTYSSRAWTVSALTCGDASLAWNISLI